MLNGRSSAKGEIRTVAGWFSDLTVKAAATIPKIFAPRLYPETRTQTFENRYARGINGASPTGSKVRMMKVRHDRPKGQYSIDPTFKVGQKVLPWQARNGFWRIDY